MSAALPNVDPACGIEAVPTVFCSLRPTSTVPDSRNAELTIIGARSARIADLVLMSDFSGGDFRDRLESGIEVSDLGTIGRYEYS